MSLKNITTNQTIIEQVRIARTPWKKAIGLMFSRKKNHTFALVFSFPVENRIISSVHMLFVFYSIDILFLNKEKIVVDKTTLKPFTLNYTPKKAAKHFIEIPIGLNKKISIGDKINW